MDVMTFDSIRSVGHRSITMNTAEPLGASTRIGTQERGAWILTAAILGSGLVFIDSTVVNVALPVLQANLEATLRQVQWVIEAYQLTLAALLLTGGSLGDLYGRR